MSGRYWTFTANIIDGQTARGEQVNTKYREIETALENIALEMNQAIRFTDVSAGTPDQTTFQLAHPPNQRALKLIGFDAGGNLALSSAVFAWRGDHAGGQNYAVNDVVRAPEDYSYSLYIARSAHTATDFASDLINGKWEVMIDLTEARRSLILHTLITGPNTVQLEAGQDVMVDVTAGPVTLVLPGAPEIGDQPINVMHVAGDIGTYPITIDRNGLVIMGFTEDMTVDTANASFGLAYSTSSYGWRIRGV